MAQQPIQAAKHRGQRGSSKYDDESDFITFLDSDSKATTAGSPQLLNDFDAAIGAADNLSQNSAPSSFSFKTETDVVVSDSVSFARQEITTSTEGSTHQWFGNFRSITKSKLGSALQGAREKALAVTEEMRRRQHERDVADDGVRIGLRGRIGNAATGVNKLSVETSTMIPVNNEHTSCGRAGSIPFSTNKQIHQ